MDETYRAEYERLYRAHWWWRARESILLGVLRRLGPKPGAAVLDVGCGNALSFAALEEFGTVRGIEVDPSLLDVRGPFRAQISTDPLESSLYDDPRWRFDVITALDVVEHIDDDRAAVARMAAMLRRGGLLIITVPAFALLWDYHDELNFHRRRYTAGSLKRTLAGHGVELLELRYLFRVAFHPQAAGASCECRTNQESRAARTARSVDRTARSSAFVSWKTACSVVCRCRSAPPCWRWRGSPTMTKPRAIGAVLNLPAPNPPAQFLPESPRATR